MNHPMVKRKREEEVQATCNYPCHLSDCAGKVWFEDYFQYETHLSSVHGISKEPSRCDECFKEFPNDDFLELHLHENHNPFVEICRSRGEATYKCLCCQQLFNEFNERSLHMTTQHAYPSDYPFEVINTGLEPTL